VALAPGAASAVQFTTYGEGRTVFEPGTVVGVSQKACGGSVGSPTGPAGAPVNGSAAVCGTASVAVSSGPDAGRTVSLGPSDTSLRVGDRIRIARGPVTDAGTGVREYQFDDFVRDAPLGVIAALFAGLLFLVARWRGLAALAGVGVAYLVLVEFMLPALLEGRSPVAVAVCGSAAILFVVLYLAHGLSIRTEHCPARNPRGARRHRRSGSAATAAAHLTGRSNEANNELQAAGVQVSITGLILCGLIVGALGVLNDVTVTQASAVWELSAADPDAGWRKLFASGMRIGRDHIASTIYTLVFAYAYAGATLPLLLLFVVSGRTTHDLLTGNEIAGEVIRGLVGGAGLLLAVPLTTFVAAVVAAGPHERNVEAADGLLPVYR